MQNEVIIEFKQTNKQGNFVPLLTAKLAKSQDV